MPAPNRGFGATLGIGSEVTWGTAVARTNWLRVVSMNLRRLPDKQPVPDLGRLGAASTTSREHFLASDFAGGPIEWIGAFDDSTILLLGHLLGTVATSGAGPFTHTVTLQNPPTGVGLTLEQILGTSNGSTDMAEVFEGCKFTTGRLSLTAGGLLMISGEIIAQTSGGPVAAGTPTYSSNGQRIAHNMLASVSFGGSGRGLNSVVIDIDRKTARNQELGSAFTSIPFDDGEMEVTMECRTKFQENSFDAALLADTQVDVSMAFTGTSSRALTITMHNAYVTDVDKPVNTKGGIEQTVRLRAEKDATDQGLTLEFVNGNASASAN